MPFPYRTILLVGVIAALSGCTSSTTTTYVADGPTNMANGRLLLEDDTAILKPDGAPEAVIRAAGNLSIDSHEVTVNATQRALLQHYYVSVLAIEDHSIATAKVGTNLPGLAMKSAALGVVNGDNGQIDKQMKAQTDTVKQEAMKICDGLMDIETTQNSLAQQLPAFKPYASLVAHSDITDCRKGK